MMTPRPRTAPEPSPVVGARWIPLTKGQFALVDDEDYERIAMHSWFFSGGYAVRTSLPDDNGKRHKISMHRVIMNAPIGMEVDHRPPGNRLDNRRSNLRLATDTQNAHNAGLRSDNKSGFKGVDRPKGSAGRWRAQICVNGKLQYIGLFDNPEAAARAYDAAATKLHGEFARVNFPDCDGA